MNNKRNAFDNLQTKSISATTKVKQKKKKENSKR